MDLPDGCTGVLTIQLQNCTVINHWICPSDPPSQYRLATYDTTGQPIRRRLMDGLTGLELQGGLNGTRVMTFTHTDTEDHATLMQTGRDTYRSVAQIDGSFHARLTGESILTGQTTQIDGVTLHEVQSTTLFTATSDTTSRKRVMQYVMDQGALAIDIWVPGAVIDIPTGEVVLDFSAVDFVWPGDAGFMTTRPTVNCGPMTS